MSKGGAGAGQAVADYELIALLQEALANLDQSDCPQRVTLTGRLAADLYWTDRRAEALALSRNAVEMARRLDNPASLLEALMYYLFVQWEPSNLEQRLAAANEMIRIGEGAAIQDWKVVSFGREARLSALLILGEIHDVDLEITAIDNLARSSSLATGQLERFRAMRALMRGEFADAENWLARELEIAQRYQDPTLLQTYTGQLGQLLGEKGDTANFASMLTGASAEVPQLPVVRMALALLYARSGRIAEAQTEFDYLAVDNFARIPSDWNWLGTIAHLAEVCVRIEDLERAPVLHRLLLPYAGRAVTLGWGDVYYNAASHYLAILSGLLGEYDRSQVEFEAALRFNRRLGAGPALARTQSWYAQMLVRRNANGDFSRARDVLRSALEAAAAFSMNSIIAEVKALDERIGASQLEAPQLSNDLERTIFRRDGDYWTLDWGGRTVRIRHLKGLDAIRVLLACPNQAAHVSELARIMDGSGAEEDVRAAACSADAGPLLDPEAKKNYRIRLNELRDELDEARSFNDIGRVDRISSEIEFLEGEMARAVGLGGRDRRAGSISERRRVRVTNAVRSAIEQIGKNHRELAEHLKIAVRTGTLCTYRPDPASTPKWEF
jgi:tetratricopeptide (TPR) repeat protein